MKMEPAQVDYTNTPAQFPPPGFSAYGEDAMGYWIELKLGAERQRFRWIHRGRFMMGSQEDEPGRSGDETLHWVNLSKGFWLAETACTQGFWQEVMGENPSRFNEGDQVHQLPVEGVSWDDCQAMISQLNQRVPTLRARLPSEAEWEYACRAGSTSPFSFGDQLTTELANYYGDVPYNNRAKGDYRERTLPVGSFAPNPWGLYQMHGNVFEWCQDCEGGYSEAEVKDPTGPESGSRRVLRGGCWYDFGVRLRSASRNANTPDITGYDSGLRLALG